MRVNYIGFFDIRTLQKGYRYATPDKISNLKISDSLITADVNGSRNYKVELNFEDKILKSSTCNCPLENGKCKHAAAIVLYLDELELKRMTQKKS
jgi:uncharacterized Zn finger protein